MPRSNVSAHGRRTRGKEQGRQRQSEPAADKGSGTGTRQAGRQRPRHTWEGAEKDSCRKRQRPRDKERSREGEGEAGRAADTGTGTEREKHNGQKKEQRGGLERERTEQESKSEDHLLLEGHRGGGRGCPRYGAAHVAKGLASWGYVEGESEPARCTPQPQASPPPLQSLGTPCLGSPMRQTIHP